MTNYQLNDPDFDQSTIPANASGNASFLAQLSPKQALLAGIVGSVLLLCTIGFFILLGFILKNKGNSESGNSAPIPVVNNQPSAIAPQPAAQAPAGAVPPVTKTDHIRGSGPITLVEYSDFECPFCKRFHPTMLQVMQEFKGKVRWVYRHFPLSFHANAQKEAEATECANEVGGNDAFWAYADKLFERTQGNGTGFALEALVPLAKELKLNESKFKSCLDSGKYAKHVQDEMNGEPLLGLMERRALF